MPAAIQAPEGVPQPLARVHVARGGQGVEDVLRPALLLEGIQDRDLSRCGLRHSLAEFAFEPEFPSFPVPFGQGPLTSRSHSSSPLLKNSNNKAARRDLESHGARGGYGEVAGNCRGIAMQGDKRTAI